MGQLVAIVGRPNVGKSTLFNRLTQTRTAITDPTAGTTRDRQYGKVEWNGKEFSIVDTGGWVVNSEDVFESEINKQVELAIEQADEILFVVDAMNGVTDLDDHVAEILRKSRKPVILVANKVDSNEWVYNVPEFYSLGLGDPYPVSAVNGYGTGDLLDEVVAKLPEKTDDEEAQLEDIPKFAIVGRPNAGKSSLINAFIGAERHIVTDIAGTTRDSIYTRYTKFGFDFYLVDTAGIRKKNKVNEDIEYYSVIRSIRAIESSDVCILMIDATRGIETQDVNIFSLIQRNKKGLVVVVNKWDLVEKDTNTINKFEDKLKEDLKFMSYFKSVYISAKTGQRVEKILSIVGEVYGHSRHRVATGTLNDVISDAVRSNEPPSYNGKRLKVYYASQVAVAPPTIVLFVNNSNLLHFSYERYLENVLRKSFDFSGTPIKILTREKSERA